MDGQRKDKVYRSDEEWKDIFRRYEGSDLTKKDFCLQEGLTQSNFYYRRRKLRGDRQSRKNLFVEVPRPADDRSSSVWRVEVEFSGGMILRVRD